LEWILDTHPRADHFSAVGYLKDMTGMQPAFPCFVVLLDAIRHSCVNIIDTTTRSQKILSNSPKTSGSKKYVIFINQN